MGEGHGGKIVNLMVAEGARCPYRIPFSGNALIAAALRPRGVRVASMSIGPCVLSQCAVFGPWLSGVKKHGFITWAGMCGAIGGVVWSTDAVSAKMASERRRRAGEEQRNGRPTCLLLLHELSTSDLSQMELLAVMHDAIKSWAFTCEGGAATAARPLCRWGCVLVVVAALVMGGRVLPILHYRAYHCALHCAYTLWVWKPRGASCCTSGVAFRKGSGGLAQALRRTRHVCVGVRVPTRR